MRPHGVKRIPGIGDFLYDDNGNLTSGAGRSITWTSFDMPLKITGAGPSATFVYGPEHQRTRQTRGDGASVVYAGAQEVEKNSSGTTVKTYWPGGIGVEIDRPNATVSELYWHHVDRLGSMIALTDQAGVLKEKLAYDSWGKRRSIDGSSTPNTLEGQVDNRGFTGHEMLDQLDLVHMNGRVYDPLVARFVSGDPILQDPIDGQNYNRYSYVLNNPTNNTDPTGFQAMTGTRLENVDTGAGCSGGCDFPLMRKRYNLNGAGQPAEGQRKEVGGKISAKAGGNTPRNISKTSANSGGPTIGQRVSNFFSQAMRSFGIFDNFVPSRESFESGARQLLGGPCEHNCAGHDAMVKSTADVMQGAAQGVADAGNRYYPELAKKRCACRSAG